jgi:hypothetical protein
MIDAMPRFASFAVLLALLPGALLHAAESVPLATRQQRIDFVVANTVFALTHEFGHAVIRDFKVPLLGLEEDSADTLAAMFMLSGGAREGDENDRRRLTALLALAAVGNALTWRSGAEAGSQEIMYWDLHGLSVRRAARIACLIYGSDPGRYGWIADLTRMPDFRRDSCPEEFAMARAAARWVADSDGQVARPVPHPAIAIEYRRPDGDDQESIRDFLQQQRIIEAVVARVGTLFAFRQPLGVKVRACGEPNAFWDPDERELRLCYELLETFWKQSANPDVARLYASIAAAEVAPPGPGTGP